MKPARRLKRAAHRLREEFDVYRLVLRHPETPRAARVLLGLAIGYTLLPFDLIPDFIPIVGHLDDAVMVPILFLVGVRCVPAVVLEACRAQAAQARSTRMPQRQSS